MTRGAWIAVSDFRLGLHADEDQLCDATAGLENEGRRTQILQLQGYVALEAGIAPTSKGVIDPKASEGRLEFEITSYIARDTHVFES